MDFKNPDGIGEEARASDVFSFSDVERLDRWRVTRPALVRVLGADFPAIEWPDS